MIELKKAHNNFVNHLKELGRAPATIIAYEKDIEQLVEHLYKLGLNQTHEIETKHLVSFMDKLSDRGYTNKTISRKTNSTKTFFRFLVKINHVEEDAAKDLEHPEVETKPPRILSRLEYGALRDAAREDERTFAMIEVLLQTGIRISELSRIKMENTNIDKENMGGNLFVPKRRKHPARNIPLNKAVTSAVLNYLKIKPEIENAKHLFITKTGNPVLVRNIRATLNRYFDKAGVENATVNDIRHTFIAHHLKKGTSLSTVSKVVGHKRVSTTERYLNHIDIEVEKEKTELGIL